MLEVAFPTLHHICMGNTRVIARCPQTGAYLWKSRHQYGLLVPQEEQEAEALGRHASRHYIKDARSDVDAIDV